MVVGGSGWWWVRGGIGWLKMMEVVRVKDDDGEMIRR